MTSGRGMSEVRLYLSQLQGLVAGRQVPVAKVHTLGAAPMDEWGTDDLKFALEAAVRHHERLWSQLEQIRGRAQFLFTTVLVVVGFGIATIKKALDAPSTVAFLVAALAAFVLLLALGGSAAVVVGSKDMGGVDPALVTRLDPPILRALAHAYADSISTSTNTVATQLTVFRDAALLTIIGALMTSLAWLVAAL